MNQLQQMQGINDAIETLTRVRRNLSNGSPAIWRIVDHAITHLDAQIKANLNPPANHATTYDDGKCRVY